MRWCEVVFKDGQQHSQLIEAASKLDAAAKGRDSVAGLSWYNPGGVMLVRPLGPTVEYRVTPAELHAWERRERNGSQP